MNTWDVEGCSHPFQITLERQADTAAVLSHRAGYAAGRLRTTGQNTIADRQERYRETSIANRNWELWAASSGIVHPE